MRMSGMHRACVGCVSLCLAFCCCYTCGNSEQNSLRLLTVSWLGAANGCHSCYCGWRTAWCIRHRLCCQDHACHISPQFWSLAVGTATTGRTFGYLVVAEGDYNRQSLGRCFEAGIAQDLPTAETTQSCGCVIFYSWCE